MAHVSSGAVQGVRGTGDELRGLLHPEKKEIRREVAAFRRQAEKEYIQRRSREIFARVEELDVYRQAETVFAYVDHANEVMTRDFIRRALRGGKNVAVPKVEGEKMRFWYMTDFSQLRPGIFGIEEPVTGEEGMSVCADDAEDALMIVPGVAFDSGCHRVGFGGGFYDRYLQTHPLHETIAVAFEEQIYASVPCEDHDRLMHMVVTPSRIICR